MGPLKLPSDPSAERAVAGSIVIEPALYGRVAAVVRSHDFADRLPRTIFDAVTSLVSSGFPVDQVSVAAQCSAIAPEFAPLDVAAVCSEVALPSSAVHHARTVARLAAQRAVIRAASAVIEQAVNDVRSPEEIVAEAAAALQDAPGLVGDEEGPSVMADVALAEIEDESRMHPHIRTGLPSLDRMLGGGLAPSKLYVVGARTSVGKSALVANIARLALDGGSETLYVSLEMTGREVLSRLVSDAYGVDQSSSTALIAAMMNDRTQGWPLRFLGFSDLAGILAAVYRRRPRLVIVDYLQLVPTSVRFERRDLEIAHITRALKLMAVRAGVPVLACAQLNRSAVRDNRPPRLSDLRESGAQEQDADCVILLDRDVDAASSAARLAVAKNRTGPTGTVPLVFDARHTRFREMSLGQAG